MNLHSVINHMKIELLGFGAKLNRKIEQQLKVICPKAKVFICSGEVTYPRVSIVPTRGKRGLCHCIVVLLQLEAVINKSGQVLKKPSDLSFSREFRRRRRLNQ